MYLKIFNILLFYYLFLNCLYFLISQVHGRNLLSIDFDRNSHTEKIYDDHRKFTLRIVYDQLGRPLLWLPSSGLAPVNVSYFFNGRLSGLQRGAMSERTEMDKQGRIISRSFADGKTWSYTYLEKVFVTDEIILSLDEP